MEKFRLSPEKLAFVESMEVPVAVYQYGGERVLTLALSKGFCDLYGYTDLAQAYRDMDNARYGDVHPDDTARLADAGLAAVSAQDDLDLAAQLPRARHLPGLRSDERIDASRAALEAAVLSLEETHA